MPINKGAVVWNAMYRFCNITQQEIGRMLVGVDCSAVSQARKRLQQNWSMIAKKNVVNIGDTGGKIMPKLDYRWN